MLKKERKKNWGEKARKREKKKQINSPFSHPSTSAFLAREMHSRTKETASSVGEGAAAAAGLLMLLFCGDGEGDEEEEEVDDARATKTASEFFASSFRAAVASRRRRCAEHSCFRKSEAAAADADVALLRRSVAPPLLPLLLPLRVQ